MADLTITGTAVVGAGVATFGELKGQVQRNWGRSDTNSNSSILFYFNAAQRLLARTYDAPELQKSSTPTLVADTRTYAIAGDWAITDLRKIYSIYLTANNRGYEMKYVPSRVWDAEVWPVIPNASSDVPRIYTTWEQEVSFHPAPDEAYATVMRYYREPILVTEDASVIDFQGMDEVLVEMTTGFCFFSMEDYVIGRQHLSLAENLLKRYGIQAEYSRDFQLKAGEKLGGAGQYWMDPFVRRSP